MRLRPLLILAALPALIGAGPPLMSMMPALPTASSLPPSAVAAPSPLAPPTAAAPAPATNIAPSPLLAQPGPVYPTPPAAGPAVLPPPVPGAIDQQKLQAYRSDLQQQARQLDFEGTSPADPRYRDIQQQLNRPQ